MTTFYARLKNTITKYMKKLMQKEPVIVTQWFKAIYVEPVHEGWYEVAYVSIDQKHVDYSKAYWDAGDWYEGVYGFETVEIPTCWRGLVRESAQEGI